MMNQTAGFCCYLDGQPDHLTPEHQLESCWIGDLAGHPLFLNEECQFTDSGTVPPEIFGDACLTSGFATMQHMAWVRNSITGALQPFWIGPQLRTVLSEMRHGQPASSFPEYYARCLGIAGVLTSPERETAKSKTTTRMLTQAADQVRSRGYAPIAGLIHPFHISALRRYYRTLVRSGNLTFGDTQSPRRYHAHNESVAKFFHFQLTHAVSLIVGQPVKPSYVYFASYQEGASLEKHTDREQCQFSITLCLDYSPEPVRQTAWPIQVHPPNGVTTVYQSIGDGLVYLGCEMPHSRGILPSGHTSTSIFFHYVPENFRGSLG